MIYGTPVKFKREEFTFSASTEQRRGWTERFEVVIVFENDVYVSHRTQKDYSDRDQPHLSAIEILQLNNEILAKVNEITLGSSNSGAEQKQK
jgi:hypothetical protein